MNISIEKRYELFVDTIKKCGIYLLSSNDSEIGYYIFEEFDIGVTSFLHPDNLQKLIQAGLISNEVMSKSSTLRSMVLELQQGDEWNINAVRNSTQWNKVLKLADDISSSLN